MNLAELKEAYKARKLALDSAKKEEEKYKALLKDAMLEAGESDYTDEAGYRFERIVQERKSMDEEKLLAELHERNLTSCIATKEVVDEDATLKAVEAGELPQEVLADALKVTEVVMLKLTAPKKAKARLTEVEQRAKSNTNRLNEHDEILKSNSEMIGAIKELATEVKYMRGDLNETVERLNKLEGKDGDKWDKFKWLIVTGLVTLILGYLAVSVGLK